MMLRRWADKFQNGRLSAIIHLDKMAAYRPLFTSTGLILRNITKTAQNGRLSTIIHLDRPHIAEYHENRSR